MVTVPCVQICIGVSQETVRTDTALLGSWHMWIDLYVCVCSWSCVCIALTFASLVSVRERLLFVLALGLAPWKCWLAAMTQRYSIRKGKNEIEQEKGEDLGWNSNISVPLGEAFLLFIAMSSCFFQFLSNWNLFNMSFVVVKSDAGCKIQWIDKSVQTPNGERIWWQ